ncbi:hypothetical protein [Pseudomonas sp. TE3610]
MRSTVLPALLGRLADVSAVRLAFLGSVLLSCIALLGVDVLARDAAFYMDISQQVAQHGLSRGWEAFDWPWFTFLLAGTHLLLRLPMEAAAYLWGVLFLAGTCALMVDCVRQRAPRAAYWACLVVLAMPAVNQFRDDIIREFGFWFFCTLALWLAMRWSDQGGWWRALAVHAAILLGALFRLEAVVLYPALLLWQLPGLRDAAGRRACLQLFWLPALALISLLAVVLAGHVQIRRLNVYLEMLRPSTVFAAFNQLSRQFADSLIYKYSADEAGRIIFFGLVASLVIKFISLMGPFSLPFLQARQWRAFALYWRDFRLAAWIALAYLAVLMIFYVRMQFLNGRYLSELSLLAVPLYALLLTAFAQACPRLAKGLVAVGLLVMLSNVLSLGAAKTQYIRTAHWLAEHTTPDAAIYYEDGRVSYYAKRGYTLPVVTREQAMAAPASQQYQYFVLDADANEPWLQAWLAENHMQVLARFANRKHAAMVVIGR